MSQGRVVANEQQAVVSSAIDTPLFAAFKRKHALSSVSYDSHVCNLCAGTCPGHQQHVQGGFCIERVSISALLLLRPMFTRPCVPC